MRTPADDRATRRLFVALELPEDLRDECARAGADLAAATGGRAVPAGNLHVTLDFLGGVAERDLPALTGALAPALTGPPIRVRTAGVTPRPSAARARLMAMELDDLDGAIGPLTRRITSSVDGVVRRDGPVRPAWPHVTLLRFSRPTPVRRSPATRSEHVFDITRVALYDSVIAPGRPPRYEEILGATLGTYAQRSPSHG